MDRWICRNQPQRFKITPDARKGRISLVKTEEGMVRFQWKDRSNDAIVEVRQHFELGTSQPCCLRPIPGYLASHSLHMSVPAFALRTALH